MILEVAGKRLDIRIQREGMGLEYSGDNGRLRREFPALQLTSLSDAIAQLYSWYSQNKHLIARELLLVDK
jgi:GDP-L-fucose synthase